MSGAADLIDAPRHGLGHLSFDERGPASRPTSVATGTFPRHFGARLLSERRAARRPLWVLASRSQGRFTIRDLRDVEAGLLPLDPDTVVALGDLYGVRIGSVLPPTARGLDVHDGTMSAGGVTVVFDPDDARSSVERAQRRLAREAQGPLEEEGLPERVRGPRRQDRLVTRRGQAVFANVRFAARAAKFAPAKGVAGRGAAATPHTLF